VTLSFQRLLRQHVKWCPNSVWRTLKVSEGQRHTKCYSYIHLQIPTWRSQENNMSSILFLLFPWTYSYIALYCEKYYEQMICRQTVVTSKIQNSGKKLVKVFPLFMCVDNLQAFKDHQSMHIVLQATWCYYNQPISIKEFEIVSGSNFIL
jgi:hypothetical protein